MSLLQAARAVTRRGVPSTSRAFSLSVPSSSAAPADPSTSSSSTPPPEPAPTPAEDAAEPVVEEEPVLDPDSNKGGKGYRAWLAGDGAQFRNGLKGKTNWLGDTPFPLNPTFSPLPPLADSLKSKIYNAYVHNLVETPSATDSLVVRAVSLKFGVGMERVRAIIRLKELEKSWKDETELLKGMESHLGVKMPTENWKGAESPESAVQTRASSKTVFEMVDVESGDSSVFLPLLSRLAANAAGNAEHHKSPARRANEILIKASKPGRAGTIFKDVSGTWEGKKMEESYDKEKTKRGKKSEKVARA